MSHSAYSVAGSDSQIAEQERQFREILEHCPAGLNVVDEDGRLLFHNEWVRELLGYDKGEMELFDTKRFWHDLNLSSDESILPRFACSALAGCAESENREPRYA
jgi:PAS domain-containing protein